MLGRYLIRLFLVRVLAVLAGMVALVQLLDLLDKTGAVIARGGLGALGRYVLLRLPFLVGEMIPLGCLVGALLCFGRLSRGLEMAALSAAGFSLRQVLRRLLPACLLLAAVQGLFDAEITPWSEQALARWWTTTDPARQAQPRADPEGDIWLTLNHEVARIGSADAGGRRIGDVTILRRAANGDLEARIDAARGRWVHDAWQLQDVQVTRPDHALAARLPSLEWRQGPVPANMEELRQPTDTLPLPHLLKALRGRWASVHGPGFLRTDLEALLAGLVTPGVMVLLAAPVLLTPPRTGSDPMGAMRTLGLGLGFLALAGLLEALGRADTLPPAVAVWTAPVLFGALGLVRLREAEAA
ncbi:LptF/LptG family permease [Rhizosaccharibacter radicis]|uniref:LptF/LptG family permease n=1 Tax=Rhizosaccharibacter radicis TaxID=2782605 RepID=A0ABT1VV15_9PROT|nr:LptF/LptG family permease [Acetobacteraceae bacterium KSS12]